MNRLFSQVKTADGRYAALLAADDEGYMKEHLVKERISVLIVIPVMETMKSRTDVYRNNDLGCAGPLAAIDGTVIGIVHFTKGTTGDLVAGINGSAAFGSAVFSASAHTFQPENDQDPCRSSADGPG